MKNKEIILFTRNDKQKHKDRESEKMRKINLSPRGISDKKFPIILNQKSKSRWRNVGTLFFPKIFFN